MPSYVVAKQSMALATFAKSKLLHTYTGIAAVIAHLRKLLKSNSDDFYVFKFSFSIYTLKGTSTQRLILSMFYSTLCNMCHVL